MYDDWDNKDNWTQDNFDRVNAALDAERAAIDAAKKKLLQDQLQHVIQTLMNEVESPGHERLSIVVHLAVNEALFAFDQAARLLEDRERSYGIFNLLFPI